MGDGVKGEEGRVELLDSGVAFEVSCYFLDDFAEVGGKVADDLNLRGDWGPIQQFFEETSSLFEHEGALVGQYFHDELANGTGLGVIDDLVHHVDFEDVFQ